MSFHRRLLTSTQHRLKFILLLNVVVFVLGVIRMKYWKANGSHPGERVVVRPSHPRVTRPGPCGLDSSCNRNGSKDSPTLMGEDFKPGITYQVPNIVHYIWYNEKSVPIKWHQMLCILSAHRFIDPDVLYFHTDREPVGTYWERIRSLPKLKVVHRDPPRKLFGEDVKKPVFYTSHSNVDRVVVLMEYGGIYLDFDVLVTRPFDDLRKYPCTIGLERSSQACGSVIVASKDSFFLRLWANSYLDDYKIDEWAYNTGKVPFKLWKRYPELVHVEETRLNRPNFKELDKLYGSKTWDWQNNYAVHLWYRVWKDFSPLYKGVEPDDHNIKTWNGTFGQLARAVLFGNPDKIVTW